MSKVYANAQEALGVIPDDSVMMFSGFGLCGIPENAITEIARQKAKDITVISNNCGNQGMGLAVFLQQRQVKKVICSYVGGNPDLEELMLEGSIEVELNPQGTLAERIRAGGAGIPAFYTPTGVGTVIAEGKPTAELQGKTCVLETGLKADFAFVKAWKGDAEGNLIFRESARNFGPPMATAGAITVAEVEELVPVGSLDPNHIHTPGIFVDRIFQGENYLNTIEKKVLRQEGQALPVSEEGQAGLSRRQMAYRAAQELGNSGVVNLGIGLPTLVADYLPEDTGIRLHSENGVLGVGPYPTESQVSHFCINAGKETITIRPGGSFFDSATSFAMIRGKHVEWAILGALEVAENGDLANWMIPGKKVTGMGGAMDLAAGAKKVIALLTHTNKKGVPKIVERCGLPLTAKKVVDIIITDLAVIDVTSEGLVCREIVPGVSPEELQAKTGAKLSFVDTQTMKIPQ